MKEKKDGTTVAKTRRPMGRSAGITRKQGTPSAQSRTKGPRSGGASVTGRNIKHAATSEPKAPAAIQAARRPGTRKRPANIWHVDNAPEDFGMTVGDMQYEETSSRLTRIEVGIVVVILGLIIGIGLLVFGGGK